MKLIDADALYIDIVAKGQANKRYKIGEAWELTCAEIREVIDDQPVLNQERKWISCSERLPEEKDAGILKKLGTSKRSEYVLATVEAKGERMTVTACTYDGKWNWNMKYAFPDYKIVAWMPLPEPARR